MEYTGEVTQGGASAVRELPDATIRKASVSAQDNNAYLITCRASGEQLLVDAADSADRLTALVAEGGDGLAEIVTTHQHWDHHRALAALAQGTRAQTSAGSDDAAALPITVDRTLEHGDTVQVGDLRLAVVHLRGHTPGSVALALTSTDGSVHLFTGDSLFPGGVGNTQKDAARFTSLIDDVEQRIFAVYPDGAWIYPGHGNDSTLGAERPQLPEWRARGW